MNFAKLNRKKRQVMGKLIVGIDVGKNTLWITYMLPSGEILRKPFPILQVLSCFEALLREMLRLRESHQLKGIIVGLESTGSYWEPLARFLSGRESIELVFVSCKTMKRERESLDLCKSKNDPKDAYLVAHLIWEGKFMPMHLQEGVWANLRRLGAMRASLVEGATQVRNRIHAIQAAYWPERRSVLVDRKGICQTSMLLYEMCPFPADVLQMGVEGLRQLARRAKKQLSVQKAERLVQAARDTIGIREGIEAARMELSLHLTAYSLLTRQLAEVEQQMVQELQKTGLAETLTSIRGVSPVGAACLLAETGDPRNFKNHGELVKLAGLNLVDVQSGDSKPGYCKRISKVGRRNLRCVLFNLTRIILVHNADFRAPHCGLLLAGKKGKQAVVAGMCRLLRVVFSLCKHGQTFRENPARKAELIELTAELARSREERQKQTSRKKSAA